MGYVDDSFLIEEVRDGFLIPADIKQSWAVQLEILGELDRVCKKYNLQYFADWGTFLGAVRHGGFIPWDDDLDVCMKRTDYQKLCEVASRELSEGYYIQNYENTKPDDWLFMGKLVNKEHMCFEKKHLQRFHNFPYRSCVDIFILDYVYQDEELEETRRNCCLYMIGLADRIAHNELSRVEIINNLKHIEATWNIQVKYKDDFVELGRDIYRDVERFFAVVPESESEYLTQLFPWGLKGTNRYYPKEFYNECVYLPFETTYMPVPLAYDAMLGKRYSNYLHVIKEAGAHEYPYFEEQKQQLSELVDFEMPHFTVDESLIYRNQVDDDMLRSGSLKGMLLACLDELRKYVDEIVANSEHSLLGDAQQLAIDMGTLIENTLGEGLETVLELERFCEALFLISNGTTIDLCDSLSSLKSVLDTEILNRNTVIFMPVHASDWDVLGPIYEEEKTKIENDVIVLPLSYYYKDYDGTVKQLVNEWDLFGEDILLSDCMTFSSELLSLIRPERIYTTNAYDEWHPSISIPSRYYTLELRKYTDELIYVSPYITDDFTREDGRDYRNMDYYVKKPGLIYADKVIVHSDRVRDMYIEALTDMNGEASRDIWEKKLFSCKLKNAEDLEIEAKKCNKNNDQKKRILFVTSLGCFYNGMELASIKLDKVLSLFNEKKDDIDVTWVTFPGYKDLGGDSQIFSSLSTANSIMSLIDDKVKQFCGRQSNITFVNESEEDLKNIIRDCDAYYGDGSPWVMDFVRTKRPVMQQNYEV